MNTTIKIETLLTGIATFFLLALLVIMPIDIADFYEDKATYAMVYHLDMNEKNWEWGYLSRWVYLGVLIIVGLTIVTLRLIKKRNEMIRKLNWTFLTLFFGTMILGFYNWMRTGFDH